MAAEPQRKKKKRQNVLDRLVCLSSAEWLLRTRANGGGVVLARALWSAALIYIAALTAREVFDPTTVFQFSLHGLRRGLFETMEWFGVILAATYASFYTRFASQWSYLANLYNQIKASEIAAPRDRYAEHCIAEWKAGFIEDAHTLHLVSKPLFALVITSWGAHPRVAEAFCAGEAGDAALLHTIVGRARAALGLPSSR